MMYHFFIVIFGPILSMNKYLWKKAGSAIRAAGCYLTSIAMAGNGHVPFRYGEVT